MSETTLTERLARKGQWRITRAKNRRAQARACRHRPRVKHSDTASIDLTFPSRLQALAEKFYQQALTHPAFVYMTASEIRQSIENRLWSIAAKYPSWWGSGPLAKRAATPAQLAALEVARAARTSEAQDRERRLAERVQAAVASSEG